MPTTGVCKGPRCPECMTLEHWHTHLDGQIGARSREKHTQARNAREMRSSLPHARLCIESGSPRSSRRYAQLSPRVMRARERVCGSCSDRARVGDKSQAGEVHEGGGWCDFKESCTARWRWAWPWRTRSPFWDGFNTKPLLPGQVWRSSSGRHIIVLEEVVVMLLHDYLVRRSQGEGRKGWRRRRQLVLHHRLVLARSARARSADRIEIRLLKDAQENGSTPPGHPTSRLELPNVKV